MPELDDACAQFLHDAGWASYDAALLAGDMSNRRYFRISKTDRSAILMIAENSQSSFQKMTVWLRSIGLSAPEVLAANDTATLLLLEDFGDVSMKRHLLRNTSEKSLILREVVALLLTIRQADPPPLDRPTPAELVAWTELADQHYPGADTPGLVRFRRTLLQALTEADKVSPCVSLRDFHSENIHWLDRRSGIQRLGLLDYQDAFITHPAYDLVSLLTDARMPVSVADRDALVQSYLRVSGDDPEAFKQAFFALSAQRNLRILGIFSRAKKHLSALPQTYRYFTEALQHEVFSEVRDEVLRSVLPPEDIF